MRAALLVLVVGCGRIAFDPAGSGGSSDGGAGGGDTPADAADTVPNIAFVTSAPVPGDMLGDLSGADRACATAAMEGGLPGHYVAYLATTAKTATERLAGARGWVRSDGKPIADLPIDLLTKMYYPVLFDSVGQPTSGSVFTGMNGDNTVGMNCVDYSSNTEIYGGDPTATVAGFADSVICSCATLGFDIYCFGTDHDTPGVAPTKVTGRAMFVTTTPWPSGGGIASADAECVREASAAGLAGTFKALLATSTATALSRFNTAGTPWVRLDGVALLATAADFTGAGPLDSPPNVGPDGISYVSAFVFTGSNAPSSAGTLATTCSDWTSASAGMMPVAGKAAFNGVWWFYPPSTNCSMAERLYCLEL